MRHDDGSTAVAIFGALLCVAIIAVLIWFHSTHHCARWETNTCTEHTCTYHDDTGNCMSWSSRFYPCQECAEWVRDAEPRKPAEKP